MHAIMRYTVRNDALNEHLELLRAVYRQLADERPAGLHWATYQLDQVGAFLEVVSGPDLPNPLPQLDSFRRYRADLEVRCVQPPEFTEVVEVGAFRAAGLDR